ncbi:O-antigen ligase family protein [Desulfitobacterium metallireducens]|uniref:Polymerase n=1 Tax=Desulfitobacterium metallireducens DSM 15288 TaxID=871968 RepID=W0EB40_9FIRM|nr:O-antigen ligase family protein [Desulfitobacterium metallireducens]AHF08085.1 polymerase [Desulfitobacterium metallireducens DSM 15288]
MKQLATKFEKMPQYLWPVILVLMIVPLIVHLKVVPLTGDLFNYWTGDSENLDFFSYYKSIFLILLSCSALILYFVDRVFLKAEGIPKYYILIPLAAYGLLITLSSMLSEHKEIALQGFPDRYEGMYVLLGYLIICTVLILTDIKERQAKQFFYALTFTSTVVGIIGLFQYFGLDFWRSTIGGHLILPSQYIDNLGKLKFSLGDHAVYSTLYHYDYYGSFGALIIPITLAIAFLTKNKVYKWTSALVSMLMVVTLFASGSRAGLVGLAVAIVLMLSFSYRDIFAHRKLVVGFVIILFICLIGLNFVSGRVIEKRIGTLYQDVKLVFSSNSKGDDNYNVPLKNLRVSENKAIVETDSETLTLVYDKEGLKFFDSDEKPLNLNIDNNGKIQLQDSRYKDYTIITTKQKETRIVQVIKGPIKLNFGLIGAEIKILDNKGQIVELKPIQSWGFNGMELIGSSRGYIWSRSIPLLKDTLFIGHGPDTFAIYFPQYDFKGKMYAYSNDMWQIVDKPHNLYLQMAINTGVLSLISFLVLIAMYTTTSVKAYFRRRSNVFITILGFGIFFGIYGYLVTGFFNDSVVSVSPVFWILLGLGISINRNVIKQCDKKQ